ncbi:MAG: methyl-accepting chemotaxis protein [Candidatus Weimeria sp.]
MLKGKTKKDKLHKVAKTIKHDAKARAPKPKGFKKSKADGRTSVKTGKKQRKPCNQSLSKEILFRLVPVTIIALVAVVVLMMVNSSRIVRNLSEDSLEQESQKNALKIENELSATMGALNMAINDVTSRTDYTDKSQVKTALEPSMQISDLVPKGVHIGLDDNTFIDPSNFQTNDYYKATKKAWYKLGQDSDEFVMGEPYIDEKSGSLVVTISRKVHVLDHDGVAACDIYLDSIVSYVSKLKPFDSGKSALISDDHLISYFNKKYNGKEISSVSDSYLQKLKKFADHGKNSVYELKNSDGRKYSVTFTKVNGTDWTLISEIDSNTIYGSLVKMVILAVIIVIIAVGVISALLYYIVKVMITKPVGHLTGNIMRIASGDFSKSDSSLKKARKSDDEIGQMNGSMSDFVMRMHQTLVDISDQTTQLTDAAKSSAEQSGDLSEQASEQSESMSQISQTMNEMAGVVTELTQNATNLADEVNGLTEQSHTTNATVKNLVDKATQGQAAMANVETEITSLSDAMQEMNQAVIEVGKSANQITSIIEMINSIASQTNLLSLNASIEAARAGEAGRGFSVVASEIGKLANNSTEATKQISDIIDEVSEKIKDLSAKAGQSMEDIRAGSDAVNSTGETFREIFSSLDETGKTVQEMIDRVGKVNDIAASVASIAAKQSASTEKVTATVETLTESAQNVADSSKKVSDTAVQVNSAAVNIENYITKFKL